MKFTEAPKIFAGSSHPELSAEIARTLGVELGKVQLSRFRNGEIYVNFQESVRGADVYIIQPFAHPVNDSFVELMVMVDALKRSSAGMINAIIPYYGYARQEKQDLPREPITAKMVADVLTTVGVQRVITFDLHAAAIQGFFNIPVDHLSALDLLASHLKAQNLAGDAVVVSPDAGRAKTAERLATVLDLPFAIMHKRRPGHNEADISHVIGDVRGKIPIIIEDIIDTGGTIVKVVEMLVAHGARPEVRIYATHAVFSPPATERLNHAAIGAIVVTNTLPVASYSIPKLTVVSVAPLLAEAISRIHNNMSVSRFQV